MADQTISRSNGVQVFVYPKVCLVCIPVLRSPYELTRCTRTHYGRPFVRHGILIPLTIHIPACNNLFRFTRSTTIYFSDNMGRLYEQKVQLGQHLTCRASRCSFNPSRGRKSVVHNDLFTVEYVCVVFSLSRLEGGRGEREERTLFNIFPGGFKITFYFLHHNTILLLSDDGMIHYTIHILYVTL